MAKKILFVDDRSEWRFIVGAWLHGAGYAVVTAKDSGEALKQVEQSEPDLAIVDVDLAGEDGIALMKALKEKHAATPVILFTGLSHDDDTILRFMREGASQYVRKGKMEDLLKAVQVLLDFQPEAG
jgi:two-component system phosphate regulon response regulator OmpR